MIRAGRIRSDAPSAEVPWTCWKLGGVSNDLCYSTKDRLKTYSKLLNSSILLLTALVKSIVTQMLVKLELRQSEFGMSAGRLRFNW